MRSFYVLGGLAAAVVMAPRFLLPDAAAAAPVAENDERVLRIEITVPAARADVWKAFSTSEGLSTWLAPGAVVDLRPGGEWMVHFPGSSSAGATSSRSFRKRRL